ncbi:hypothetical protein M422DRAFT_785858 [Sphaerobolus stellatus SS14]|uniref:P-type ATPase A domain-containing protein n=1 Tax=Sphaerobolus stellatus (strain SS14) TaxID=990650 RepID=A0A0C9UH39_SPHS4|nr:hypothetical protein M422DRAFT_785858 [Sphaerobolus stellatus SS14]
MGLNVPSTLAAQGEEHEEEIALLRDEASGSLANANLILQESHIMLVERDAEPPLVGHGGCRPRRYRSLQRSTPSPDWEDFVGIVALLFINSAIGFYEERNAGNAVKALMDSLAPKARIGDVVPADCRLTEAINVSIDQAALTGESLVGDQCFSGSTCKQGEAEISIGPNTFFGRAATLVGQDDETTGHLQKILAQIGSFCLVVIGIFVLAEILVLYAGFRYDYRRGLDDILVLLIGGIPIAMPTIFSSPSTRPSSRVQIRLPAVHDSDYCPPQRRHDHDPLRRSRPPLEHPDAWDLAEIFAYAVAYGLYLTISTIILVVIIIESNFFEDKFGVSIPSKVNGSSAATIHNDPQLHMVIYLQVAIISQALIFVTRAHGFFMERPSWALLGAFCIAQLVSSIIPGFADWGFTKIHSISGGWIGIVWVWNILWFVLLDLIKFAMKATVIKFLRERRMKQIAQEVSSDIPLTRTQSRAASVHESLYSNRVSFIKRAARKVGFGGRVTMSGA